MAFKGNKVTFIFAGPKAEKAAEILWVQYLDGGLDQYLEARLEEHGAGETEYTCDEDSATISVTTK